MIRWLSIFIPWFRSVFQTQGELALAGSEKLNFPDDYIDFIRAVPVTEDSNEKRHAKNMELVEKIRSGT